MSSIDFEFRPTLVNKVAIILIEKQVQITF